MSTSSLKIFNVRGPSVVKPQKVQREKITVKRAQRSGDMWVSVAKHWKQSNVKISTWASNSNR